MTLTATPLHFISAALVFCVWLYTRHWWHLPPGIRGLRLLNVALQEKPWLKLLEINRQYGDIASGSLLGNHLIFIGSAKIAEDLLEKRSTNYSDRPRSVMCGELSGWGKITLLSNYDDWFRQHRKWFAQEMGSHATVTKLHGMIELETRRYLRCILDDPGNAHEHVRKHFTSISLRLAHGYVTQEGNDPLVELAHIANGQLSATTIPGAYLVDLFPLMKYIPSWLPGAGFKREAKEYAAVVNDLVEIPHRYVKSRLAAGTALPSLGARLLSQPGLTEEREDCVKWATATMYQDTANSVAYAFYLAMTLHPVVMKKAQEELASVVGTSRLPTFADRPSLPYLEAVFTELLRWHNPAPLTIRRTRVDDEYNGYFIPAGSWVFVNIWAILRDEETYTNPLEFRPERFLGANPEAHPAKACFGYFLVHSALWLTCAQVLAAFDISKCVEYGVEITPKYTPVGEILIHQAPFKCSIRPRSSEAEGLIRQEFAP
ncbi:cytochrome P450 [Melanogaster broomeanus]|nr:cytochrome P450 [Melanogaster broomeanus]